MNPTNPKPKTPSPFNDALIEQLRDLSRGVGNTGKDVVGGIANDALSSLFGTPKSGNLQPGQELSLGQKPPPPPPTENFSRPFPRPERFPFPFRKKEQPKPLYSQEQIALMRQQEQQVAQKIEEIRIELKGLIAEIKTVDKEVQQAVEGNIVGGDTYHLTYLDRIKVMLKNMLKQLTESQTWLNTQKSRKKQMGYWNQYKKKGTSFGLSHERSVATQVG